MTDSKSLLEGNAAEFEVKKILPEDLSHYFFFNGERLVFDYLLKSKNKMPRYAYRYAMQKLDDEKKRILLQ